ncbi:OLC1v1017349C1 [Oldenlandia corymbosa var. corymbosa]|uniref:OLC1v1017349C1 n=1 Tax=Oldenlandia corymbosa var. corymbosa TaxID=529605 RepID=A0AAV1E9A2_OLDCO|nr:OLC1v1017349C1 [Oldenlandia corymbosa var. corymbosa]
MENTCHSSGGGGSTVTSSTSTGGTASISTATATATTTANTGSGSNRDRDVYLKHLNKISHKISKPTIRRSPSFDRNLNQNIENLGQPSQTQVGLPQTQPAPAQAPSQQQQQQQQAPPQQHQPPVYNINKNDFRDVVQRLTGSPAHERFSTPPPIQPPKPPSSRLQRIRPPPLAQINNRPPQLPQISNHPGGSVPTAGFFAGQRQPLSPLPPFPAVHAAAESPISAYMRFLQSSSASAASPRWNNLPPPQLPPLHHQQQQNIPPPPPQAAPQFPPLPTSPLAFGCIPSPRSPYGMMPPGMLFSPSQLGLQQLPLSPTLPVTSPRWKGM